MKVLSPFVYWAQTEYALSLKIDLKNASEPCVKLIDNRISFAAEGTGAQGTNRYEFSLDLFSPVMTPVDNDEDKMVVRVFDDRISILIQKVKPSWWPRLTAQPQKPAWLKINFDLWKSEECQDSDEEKRDVMKDYPGMYDKLHKEELGYRKEDIKKVYLVVYNLFQFVGYLYIMSVMAVRYVKLENESIADTYEHVGPAMKFLQLLQYLEVMHPLFGYVKGGVLFPFLQVTGRAFALFIMIECEPRMQTKPVIFYLFIVWSSIEIVRYPFYISQLYKKEIYILTWLRYTLWIPLYPLGVVCESIIILRNIPYFEETHKFTVSLPNEWNFAFHLPTFMKLYLLLVIFPGLYSVMGHMYKLRVAKLKPKIIIKKVK